MYKIGVHKRLCQVIAVFYFMRLWNDYQPEDIRKRVAGIFIISPFLYYLVSVTGAAFTSETNNEQIYLSILSITGLVLICKFYYLVYRHDEIIELTNKIGVYSVEDSKEFGMINKSINVFVNYTFIFNVMVGTTLFLYVILPIFSSEKRLPVEMSFPVNWRENEFIYWVTYLLVSYAVLLTFLAILLNTIIWYLMMSCVIKYKMLGNAFKNLGLVRENSRDSNKKQDLFLVKLIVLIKNHRSLQEITDQLKSCFANLFFLQIGTSGLNICFAVYNLGFNSPDNLFMHFCYINVLVYEFFDIFILTYFGNDIKFWSTRLSYSLFECNWMDQSEKCKKYVFILMEVLKRPQVLVIGKLYPLDLEIFNNILNFAYGTFNLLNGLQK